MVKGALPGFINMNSGREFKTGHFAFNANRVPHRILGYAVCGTAGIWEQRRPEDVAITARRVDIKTASSALIRGKLP